MDPVSIIVEIEIATLLLAGVASVATWVSHKNQDRAHKQRERQHQEMKALYERHHREKMAEPSQKTINE